MKLKKALEILEEILIFLIITVSIATYRTIPKGWEFIVWFPIWTFILILRNKKKAW